MLIGAGGISMIEMEKTSSKKQSIPVKRKKGKKSEHGSVDVVHSRFYDELKFAETEAIHLQFDELIDEIIKQGERFAKNPNQELLKIYKSMIKDFLKYVTDHMLQVEHHTGGKLKQKIYTVTKIIDQRLVQLTEYLLQKQAGNINLLSTLDEIRGLLVDLYK
jgi:uncharacterized protein YaaR (DUF327 family)